MTITRRGRDTSVPNLSMDSLKKVSHLRRGQIEEVVENIEQSKKSNSNDRSDLCEGVHGSKYMTKTAMAGPVTLPGSSYSMERLGPEVYSPLFQLSNMNMPRDRVTMNAWNRIFYDMHPIVRNAINLHSSYPISKINISCKDKSIQDFFLEMAEKIDLYSVVYGVASEFWRHGEAFPYAELDQKNGTWKRVTVLNPDYIHVDKSVIGDQLVISLRPDAALKKIINSANANDIAVRRRLPQYIIDYVKKGQNIPLDNFNISHLKLLSAPYDIRGTSIIVSCYKDLMRYDKIMECKLAQFDGMVNPMTHVTVGEGDYKPTTADLMAVKNLIEEGQYDKDFKMITHNGVKIERVGFSGAVLETTADIELINNNLYVGLMVPKALIEQESATYASSSVGLEVLRQRYDIFRNMIKKWLEQKIFAPISEINEFFEYVDGEKRLIVPNVDFNHMNLWDMDSYISNIATHVEAKNVSIQTLHRSLGLSYEEEMRRIKEETIEKVIRAKEEEVLTGMRLSELRSITIDSNIIEPAEGTQVDMSEEEGLPGVGGPDLGGMGMPPMGGGPPPGEIPPPK